MKGLIRNLRGIPLVVWLYWSFLLLMVYGFAVLAEEVVERDRIGFDGLILELLQSWRTDYLDAAAILLDIIGGSYFLIPVTAVLALTLWRKHRRSGVFFGVAVAGAVALNGIAKVYFERARPGAFQPMVPTEGYAFPSGHSMGSTAFALAVFFVIRYLRPQWQWPALLLGIAFAVAVGVSRAYLQVHYPSDVIAGWTLSSAWVLGLNVWYSYTRPSPPKSLATGTTEQPGPR